MSMESLYKAIVTYLRSNLTDPLNRRANWIYFEGPITEPSFPAIIVLAGSAGRREELGIGTLKSRYIVPIDLDIYTDSKAVATVGNTKYVGRHLLAYICDSIIELFTTNRLSIIDTLGAIDFSISPPYYAGYDEALDVYRALIALTVEFEK